MADKYMQTVLTPNVLSAQGAYFGRTYHVENAPERDALTSRETDFLATRDSFYLATVSETGWPYVQHRGGPSGFLRTLDDHTLGFADYKGNRQLLSTGNLIANNRVSLFLMDYNARERLKILGYARVLNAHDEPELAAQLTHPEMEKRTERLFLIDVLSYDWNCPQYITQRFTSAEVEAYAAPLKARIAELEREVLAARDS